MRRVLKKAVHKKKSIVRRNKLNIKYRAISTRDQINNETVSLCNVKFETSEISNANRVNRRAAYATDGVK